MWDWLNNWVSNPTIVLAAIAVAGLFWRIGRWTQHVDAGLQTLGNRIDTLRDEIDTFRDEVRQHLVETRRTLDTLLLRVGGSEAIAAGKSPLRLTDRGKRIAASLNMDEWIASTAEKLRARTEGLEPFEIDALCNELREKEPRRRMAPRRGASHLRVLDGRAGRRRHPAHPAARRAPEEPGNRAERFRSRLRAGTPLGSLSTRHAAGAQRQAQPEPVPENPLGTVQPARGARHPEDPRQAPRPRRRPPQEGLRRRLFSHDPRERRLS